MTNKNVFYVILVVFIVLLLGLVGLVNYFFGSIDLGTIGVRPGHTITVVGSAKSQEKNQKASFSVGVYTSNLDKQIAINQANEKIDEIINKLIGFGISKDDIKTENMSIYQVQPDYYNSNSNSNSEKRWDVNNSINFTLRDIEKTSAVSELLAQTGATNVYGPNFTLEDTTTGEEKLFEEAIVDAKNKADLIAKASSKKVGKIISITEENSNSVYYSSEFGMGGGGGKYEPGTSTLSKSLTVVFQLK